MYLVICNFIYLEMNMKLFLILRFCILVLVCYIWYIYSWFVNRKDWFRVFLFNDGIIFFWKFELCYLFLLENRSCIIK